MEFIEGIGYCSLRLFPVGIFETQYIVLFYICSLPNGLKSINYYSHHGIILTRTRGLEVQEGTLISVSLQLKVVFVAHRHVSLSL